MAVERIEDGVMSATLWALAVSAGTTAAAARRLDAAPPGGRARWERTNHSGRTLTLLEGPALVAGCAAGVLAAPPPVRGAALLAVLGAGALGAIDDHAGSVHVKGLRGHLGALRHGQVTTGAVKIVGLAATGLLAAAMVDRPRRASALVGTLTGGVVVAGAANVTNLLDLRPGRALKACSLAVVPLLGGPGAPAAGAVLGAALASAPADLRRRSMMGDTGANALGALGGTAAVAALGTAGRATLATGLAALVLASEKVSFTKVIEATPVLRELDAWGRSPA